MTTTTSCNEQAFNDTSNNPATAAAATATAASKKASFPEAVTHFITSKNGRRKICYYTFRVTEDSNTSRSSIETATSNKHPVLYLHGFPGSGLEGGLCARQVAAAGGTLFALDRPGFGGTDPNVPSSSSSSSSNEDNDNDQTKKNKDVENIIMEQAIQDMWDVIHEEKWHSFSLIGVSGGGPYTLCFLNSYLEQCHRAINNDISAADGSDNNKTSRIIRMPPPKLHAISLVAALCPCIVVSQQDTTDMLPNVKMIYDLVASQKTSWWSRFKLHVMMGMTALLVTWIPTSWLVKMTASISNPQLPSPDQAVCRNDEATSMGLVSSMKVAMQQGSRPAIQEACALFRKVAPCWLSSLQTFYQDKNKEKKDLYDDDDDDVAFTRVFPNICIHHGKLDANVPLSNAEYMFKHIFFSSTGHVTKQQQNDDDQSNSNDNSNNRIGGGGGVVKLVVYEDLGHVSLVTTKTDEIARFAVLSS